ncbi:MAG: F-box protein [Legionellales bacterium]
MQLNELPLEIKELIYKNLNLHDLLTLRSTNKAFRDHIDTVIAGHHFTVLQLRSSKQIFLHAFKYYNYIEARADPFAAIITSLLKVKPQISSTELAQQINNEMLEIERLVKFHHSNQEPIVQEVKVNVDNELREHTLMAYLGKATQMVGSIQAIVLILAPILSSLSNIHNKDTLYQILTFIAYALLIYFAVSIIYSRYQDFTQVNRDFHASITQIADQHMQTMAQTIRKKNNPDPIIVNLWKNSQKFLQTGVDQLTPAPNATQLSLPQSEINLKQLQIDWKKEFKSKF